MTQALITLNLELNGIDQKGAQYLADGLKNNGVNIFFVFVSLICVYSLSHRR